MTRNTDTMTSCGHVYNVIRSHSNLNELIFVSLDFRIERLVLPIYLISPIITDIVSNKHSINW